MSDSGRQPTRRPWPPWLGRGTAALAATAAAALLYLVETELLNLDLRAMTMPGSEVVERIALPSVFLLAGGASLLAWLAATVLDRGLRGRAILGLRARPLFIGGGILVLLSSFWLLTWAQGTEAVLGLLPLHLLTAAIVIPLMGKSIRG